MGVEKTRKPLPKLGGLWHEGHLMKLRAKRSQSHLIVFSAYRTIVGGHAGPVHRDAPIQHVYDHLPLPPSDANGYQGKPVSVHFSAVLNSTPLMVDSTVYWHRQVLLDCGNAA